MKLAKLHVRGFTGWLIRPLCILVPLLMLLSAAIGQEADVEPERYFRVPGGGTLSYTLGDGKQMREVVSICYSGPPEWLVEQKDVRSHWHKIATLEEIQLHMTETVTPEEMAYIANLKSVSSLRISETNFHGRALAPLEKMTRLKSLGIDLGSHLSRLDSAAHDLTLYEYPRGDFFQFLEKLTELESFDLGPECDEQTYVRICGLKNLKWLSVWGQLSRISGNNAALIANLRQLEHVDFPMLEDPTPFLQGLSKHPRLKELSFNARTLDATDVDLIVSMKKLEKLRVNGERIDSLSSLRALTKLKSVDPHPKRAEK